MKHPQYILHDLCNMISHLKTEVFCLLLADTIFDLIVFSMAKGSEHLLYCRIKINCFISHCKNFGSLNILIIQSSFPKNVH